MQLIKVNCGRLCSK